MSNSSLSINNDSDTPPNPLTPPPSPLSPNEQSISCAQLPDTESSDESHENYAKPENDDDSQKSTAAAPDGETVRDIFGSSFHFSFDFLRNLFINFLHR